MTRELTCIICPKGCRLKIQSLEQDLQVEGQGCERGTEYAESEILHPQRTVTTTVRYLGCIPRLPVRTDKTVLKHKIMEVIHEAHQLVVSPPVVCGQILITGIAGTEACLIATRSLD